jgi:TM2 domain-containing membrane protein YozV
VSTPGLPDEFSGYQPQRPEQPNYGYQYPGMPSSYGYPGYPQPGMPPPYGYPGYPQQPPPYSGYPAPSYNIDPAAPYGRDPATGQPLSDKSALAGGLLQIFFGILGIGRFYIGSNTIAVLQLCALAVVFVLTILTFGLASFLGFFLWIFAFIDGILMITGQVKDGQGRKLRPAGN